MLNPVSMSLRAGFNLRMRSNLDTPSRSHGSVLQDVSHDITCLVNADHYLLDTVIT